MFDTGSCEIWVPHSSCESAGCWRRHKFPSAVPPRQLPLTIQYLSGELRGFRAVEHVHLGSGVTVKNQTVDFATAIDIPLLADIGWDGIVGLGFRNEEQRDAGIFPLMDTLIDQGTLTRLGKPNIISHYLGPNTGSISFGEIDPKFKRSAEEDFAWAEVVPGRPYWTVKVINVMKVAGGGDIQGGGGEPSAAEGGHESIVDTGTYLIYAPKETFRLHFSELSAFAARSSSEICELRSKMPWLLFQLVSSSVEGGQQDDGGKVVELILTPDDYVLQFKNDGQIECMIGIAPDDAPAEDALNGWTLGQVFLRAFYTVFDRDNQRVGFVRARA